MASRYRWVARHAQVTPGARERANSFPGDTGPEMCLLCVPRLQSEMPHAQRCASLRRLAPTRQKGIIANEDTRESVFQRRAPGRRYIALPHRAKGSADNADSTLIKRCSSRLSRRGYRYRAAWLEQMYQGVGRDRRRRQASVKSRCDRHRYKPKCNVSDSPDREIYPVPRFQQMRSDTSPRFTLI